MTTPNWHKSTGTTSPGDVNQNLGSHQTTEVYEGSIVRSVTGVFAGQQTLLSVSVDRPFTMSGTEVDRVQVPVSAATGWGSDLIVGLYADSGGLPTGSAIVSTAVPWEFVVGSQSLGAPSTVLPISSAWQTDPNLNLPAVWFPTYFNQGVVSTGGTVVVFGGTTVTAPAAFAATAQIGDTSIGPWQAAPNYPVAAYSPVGTATSDGHIVTVGGVDGSANPRADVYTASVSTDGTLAAWASATAYPFGLFLPAIATVNGTVVFVIGGEIAGTGSTAAVNSTTVVNGVVGTWTAQTNFPIAVHDALATVCGNWLVVTGGNNGSGTITNVYAALIHSDGSLGSWAAWPSLPSPQENHNAAFVNGVLYLGGGKNGGAANNAFYGLPISSTGPGSWTTLTNFPAGANNDASQVASSGSPQRLLVIGENNVQGVSAALYTVPTVSVPLRAIGLSNGATYHIVISETNADPSSASQVVIVASASGGGTPHFKVGAGAWQTFSGITTPGVPVSLFTNGNPPFGRVVHLIEDMVSGSPQRWTWLVYQYNGQLAALGETTAGLAGPAQTSVVTMQYDSSGAFAGTGSPYGWASSAWGSWIAAQDSGLVPMVWGR